MGPENFFVEFVVAGAVGGLIGVEREHREDGAPVLAGVRTFPLISIAGFLVAFLALQTDASFVVAAGIAGGFGLAFMFIQSRKALGIMGLTTPVAVLVTFLLGIVIGYGYTFEAVVVGVVATFLLVTKKRLHGFARILDDEEILSTLQFITLVFILLPLTASLPATVLGLPWLGRGALVDPYLILLVVIFVSSVSFVSLLAMRQIGAKRGIEFSGLLGGLVNSEATTAGLAQRAKEHPPLVSAAVVGSILASTTMLARNAAIAGVADRSLRLLVATLPYLLPIAVVGAIIAYRLRSGEREEDGLAIRVKNPFAVLPALRFALIFAGVSLLANLATRYLGEAGVYVTSLGGFVSAGAVIASMASLVGSGTVSVSVALRVSLLATAWSVLGKIVILRAVDDATYRRARTPYLLMGGTALAMAVAAFAFG